MDLKTFLDLVKQVAADLAKLIESMKSFFDRYFPQDEAEAE